MPSQTTPTLCQLAQPHFSSRRDGGRQGSLKEPRLRRDRDYPAVVDEEVGTNVSCVTYQYVKARRHSIVPQVLPGMIHLDDE